LDLTSLAKGVKPGLNRNDVYQINVFFPLLAEQQKIVAHLDKITSKIDSAIDKIEREISLLGEYRTRLISDVVTGKVNVQNVAESNKIATVVNLSKQHTKNTPYEDAVILATLVKKFGNEQFPFTAFDCQKFPYLFHRHIEGVAQGYYKFAAGPYNPALKYKTARPIAIEKNYIREHVSSYKGINYKGFVASENVNEAIRYFDEWYGEESVKWLEQQFRFIPNRKNELELLTTVDMAMLELVESKEHVTVLKIKEIIKTSPAWKNKLTRPIFSDENIERAINWSYKLFGIPTSVENKDS
jgi:type I restriction enzyme S subunit